MIMQNRAVQYTVSVIMIAATLIAWELGVRLAAVPVWLLPAPSDIAKAAVEWRQDLLWHTLNTAGEALGGFALAIAVGLLLAVAMSMSRLIEAMLHPLLLAIQSVPKVALAPLIILWLGTGVASRITTVFLVCFFPIIVAAHSGLTSTPAAMLDIARLSGASRWRTMLRIRLPHAAPQIFVGLRIAVTFCVIGAVIGEFVASQSGLGYLIMIASAQFQAPVAFAAIIVLALLSAVLYGLVMVVERLVVTWQA